MPVGYRVHDAESLRHAIGGVPALAGRLGGQPAGWTIREIGDGNLNLVFRLAGPDGGMIVKQALPYLRLVGQSWPLSTLRSCYESLALREFGRLQPDRLPAVLHADPVDRFIAMELLAPHVPLRNALLEGRRFDRLADHLADYLADILFHTSGRCLGDADRAALAARFGGNHEMLAVTDTLVFTEPLLSASRNRWTRPELDPLVVELKQDADLRSRVAGLRRRFLQTPQALLHGDLHTSSIMVTPTDTQIIDPEFVCYGPMGFDIGVLLGDLLLSYFAQAGHHRADPGHGDWILALVEAVWLGFRERFARLCRHAAGVREAAADTDLGDVFQDMAGFAAVEMMRRILGLAHVIDFELIGDRTQRAACETAALLLSRRLMLSAERVDSIHMITDMARRLGAGR